ncbi:MAG: type II toxin-antitoxin system RelE/ParE family toxin [Jaaginema sp. PMC 1079.18]|nr:type II toxin-antitoxin system RelE/ParE family toxin [Jaaginema sp. PMC 1080.18]MEC4850934.1 type II toxin-antitoxin system RelE/ParE family toxin [Jaaginema sp. PMC 1079.18]MEC4865744.1 type II toxin-antitoxin system RelE/ParE family toxin [Jaaginema sp. PMC 1078.18]
MVNRVVWSMNAVEDVDAIATYIGRDSASYAAAVVQKILNATQELSHFPGEEIAEFGDPTLREKYAYCYRIVYRHQDQIITIAAVVHDQKLLHFT